MEKFEPFQKVLVRDYEDRPWRCAFYSHNTGDITYPYACVSSTRWKYCIPYDGNEYLLGTTDSPTPKGREYKFGEIVAVRTITGWERGLYIDRDDKAKLYQVVMESDRRLYDVETILPLAEDSNE